jgi:hypothetical protein
MSPGMNTMLDPRDSRPPLFDVLNIVTEVRSQADPVELPKVLIQYDVSLPLERQMEVVRRRLDDARRYWLRKTGNKQKTLHTPTDKFPLYLRLLDFKELGASDSEIGQALFPHHSGERLRNRIRDTLAAAHRWQKDYLLLALHRPAAS